ncbi:TPA: UDP-N-acetylmuramoyl-L-alanine--D-glutamate ligase [Candidatus Poribacteria bacterium]|nr:UDP-N-acetylmuramoyl-L-alanine--D-glutamate ligase [Candidatus Poribacteria bacterium]HIB90258.1 UDP-N-acetylmuramoyl-L-alanine--D-glutamate ligase [Candidatus Poribacteria bacterium]HIC03330.1 UDP-N-acetylmuramoyl-L-alanine--D-glutamate ligase [Candidatus Poribacteria bacterium]HIC19198.1 UDP-N-acetylmuramoyl-L-alanine--D-glutamate ligase [Candidatus Poribacteria bacterium]HIN29118.1 UDP-N-acetylmuramoyl-L-alanine--D-glutamate ligase [Candidatus Poribacteria bacterium]
MKFEGKQITVFGLSRSGIAVSRLLHDLGANLCVTDPKSADQLKTEIDALSDLDIDFLLGGHKPQCIKNKDMLVVSPGVPLDIPILVQAKHEGIPIRGELEVAASVCRTPIVAITGTKGKSTTTILTGELLKRGAFGTVCVAGNIGNPLSNDVQRLVTNDIVVAEVSSFQLETTINFCPLVSVVLNIARDHLDRHQTMQSYQEIKQNICQNQTDDHWIILNAGDSKVLSFANNTRAKPVYFSDSTEPKIGSFLRNDEIWINWQDQLTRVCHISEIRLKGRHNIRNMLAAIAVAQIFEISPSDIRSTVINFVPQNYPVLAHAFEFVGEVNGIRFINDSKATNVIAVRAALESIEAPIILIMGGYDKGNNYEPLIGLIQSKVKKVILLGGRTQIIRNALSEDIVTLNTTDMSAAVHLAYEHSELGDVVLLSPANASFDMFEDYQERGQTFRKVVTQLESKVHSKQPIL